MVWVPRRKVKIVCTIGPASHQEESLKNLIAAGMDVARLNFSHGDHEFHKENIARIRKVSTEMGKPVAILQDLQGPKIRVGRFEKGAVELIDGQVIYLRQERSKDDFGTSDEITTSYPHLLDDLKPGNRVLLDDGNLEFTVLELGKDKVKCRVIHGGTLKDRKGMNLPGVDLSIKGFTEKDRKDLIFGLSQKVDFVALSFVRTASDIQEIQKLIHANRQTVPVIAKIEKPEAVENIDSIIDVSYGIMIARGDMAVEVGNHLVPPIQKQIIRKCNEAGRPVITATQMLESMINSPQPTRAEASDVANAVFDGTDAVMLSGETAAGSYPVQTVQTMSRIVEEAEKGMDYSSWRNRLTSKQPMREAISQAAVITAENIQAQGIACITNTASTVRKIASYRPSMPILGVTDQLEALRRMSLLWGVKGVLIDRLLTAEDIFNWVDQQLVKAGMANRGEVFVMTAGAPILTRGTTNLLKLHPITTLADGVKKNDEEVQSTEVVVDFTKRRTTFILDQEICIGCQGCVDICPQDIFEQIGRKASLKTENCVNCTDDYSCVEICPTGAVEIVKTF